MIRVMVVEDYDIIRDDIANRIGLCEGFNVVAVASSAEEAIKVYDPESIDVILMDIEMEEPDSGIKAAKRILDRNPDAHIVYLTSHDSDSVVISALATGADDYIVKGSSIDEIIAHIDASFRDEPMLDAKIQKIVMGEYKRLRESEQSLLYFIQHLGSLTPAEKELVGYLLDGLKVKDIAKKRFVEPVTVKSQIRTLLQKFHSSRTSEVVKIVKGLGLEHLFRNS